MFVRRNASRLAALTVPLVLAAGSLAGCSDGEADPGPAPSTSASSPSPSESASSPSEPVEPTLPAEAQGDDAEAAKAFVRHYYDALNYAQATGDIRYLKSLGMPSCTVCSGVAARLSEIYEQGGRIEGGDFTVKRDQARLYDTKPNQPRVAVVHVRVHNSAQRVVNGPTDLPDRLKAGTSKAQFLTSRDRGGWQVAEWEPVQ